MATSPRPNQGDTVSNALLGKLQLLIWLAGLTPLALKVYDSESGGVGYNRELCPWPWWVALVIAVVALVLHLAIEDVKQRLAPPEDKPEPYARKRD